MQLDFIEGKLKHQSQVSAQQNAAGVIVLNVKNQAAQASISLQAGQLLSWQPADQAHPVIWCSSKARLEPDVTIRGGVPICWPWFGAHPEKADFPAHGFVRATEWSLLDAQEISAQETKIVLGLQSQPKFDAFCAHKFLLQLDIRVGKQLYLALITENQSSEEWVITQALHTYFQISDLANMQITGLDGLSYLDKVANYAKKQQQGNITSAGEEIDRIYLASAKPVTIEDSGFSRRIRIEKAHSNTIVVWNPGTEKGPKMADMTETGYRELVCVETLNAAEDVARLAAGARYSLETTYSVESI